MKFGKIILTLLVVVGLAVIARCGRRSTNELPHDIPIEPLPVLAQELKAELTDYLTAHYKTPEEYIIAKFAAKDIIFLGEYHRIKHDVELVQNLIPLLYENGIYILATEFACYEDQEKIDLLVNSKEYNHALAREIQFNYSPWWGFQEYMDLYQVVWAYNVNLPPGAKKFRIIGLGPKQDWRHVQKEEDKGNEAIMALVFKDGIPDSFMAEVVKKEIIAHNEKALIYAGINHAFTKFREPNMTIERMGNIIYNLIGEKSMTIALHCLWDDENFCFDIYPVDGVIDALMLDMPKQYQPVGFDVIDGPFADLKSSTGYLYLNCNNFTLGDYCDGYIYTKPFSQYQSVKPIANFINEENRVEAIHQTSNPPKNFKMSVDEIAELIRTDLEKKEAYINLFE